VHTVLEGDDMLCIVLQFMPSCEKVAVCRLVSKGWLRCSLLPMSWRGVGGWCAGEKKDDLAFVSDQFFVNLEKLAKVLPCWRLLQSINLSYVELTKKTASPFLLLPQRAPRHLPVQRAVPGYSDGQDLAAAYLFHMLQCRPRCRCSVLSACVARACLPE